MSEKVSKLMPEEDYNRGMASLVAYNKGADRVRSARAESQIKRDAVGVIGYDEYAEDKAGRKTLQETADSGEDVSYDAMQAVRGLLGEAYSENNDRNIIASEGEEARLEAEAYVRQTQGPYGFGHFDGKPERAAAYPDEKAKEAVSKAMGNMARRYPDEHQDAA